jgi:hypothetical protein
MAVLAVSQRPVVAGILVTSGDPAQETRRHSLGRRRVPLRPLRAVITACLTVAIAGCGGETPTPGPVTPPPSVSAPSQDARGTAEELALGAYRGMWRAYAKAGLEANPDEPELARYASGSALKTLTSGLASYRTKGHLLKGEYVSAPQAAGASPAPAPSTVTVTDCLDDANFLVYDAAGKRVDDEPGGRRATRATVSDLGADGWKVTSFGVQEVGTC